MIWDILSDIYTFFDRFLDLLTQKFWDTSYTLFKAHQFKAPFWQKSWLKIYRHSCYFEKFKDIFSWFSKHNVEFRHFDKKS